MHYAELATKTQGNGQPNGNDAPEQQQHQHQHNPFVPPHMSAVAQIYAQLQAHVQAQSQVQTTHAQPQGTIPADDFRARFSRSLTAPSPYGRAVTGPSAASTSSAVNVQNPSFTAIAAAVAAAAKSTGMNGVLQTSHFMSVSNAQSGVRQVDAGISTKNRRSAKRRKVVQATPAPVDLSMNGDEPEEEETAGDGGDGDAHGEDADEDAIEILEKT